jgi:hypothetical protein
MSRIPKKGCDSMTPAAGCVAAFTVVTSHWNTVSYTALARPFRASVACCFDSGMVEKLLRLPADIVRCVRAKRSTASGMPSSSMTAARADAELPLVLMLASPPAVFTTLQRRTDDRVRVTNHFEARRMKSQHRSQRRDHYSTARTATTTASATATSASPQQHHKIEGQHPPRRGCISALCAVEVDVAQV